MLPRFLLSLHSGLDKWGRPLLYYKYEERVFTFDSFTDALIIYSGGNLAGLVVTWKALPIWEILHLFERAKYIEEMKEKARDK